MATGLLALLDDIVALAKLAAASLDDVVAQTAKSTSKAAGIVIDDAAVTPRYVVGLSPSRELPIIGRIALGSLKNKLVFLLPAALVLGYFANWAITPLLMIGGIYLCYEGVEKLYSVIFPDAAHTHEKKAIGHEADAVTLENQKVKSAVRTDFILSAEIMALTLADISEASLYMQGFVLAAVGLLITLAVYGFVAIIVKADDVGIAMAKTTSSTLQFIGRNVVHGMPFFLKLLAALGTVAMLWVGGSILVHGLAQLGIPMVEHVIHDVAVAVATSLTFAPAIFSWFATSALQAVFAIVIGAFAVLGMEKFILPMWSRLQS